jgi:hypothetical protein
LLFLLLRAHTVSPPLSLFSKLALAIHCALDHSDFLRFHAA